MYIALQNWILQKKQVSKYYKNYCFHNFNNWLIIKNYLPVFHSN